LGWKLTIPLSGEQNEERTREKKEKRILGSEVHIFMLLFRVSSSVITFHNHCGHRRKYILS
jgi:hypothetical protein